MLCTFCNQKTHLVFQNNNFYRCPNCTLIYNLNAKSVIYEEDYFEKEYQQQYNTTYLRDKQNIQKRMNERLKIAFSVLSHNKTSMQDKKQKKLNALEIGSAAGFFLEILQQKNIQATGWEISQKMTQYANKEANKKTNEKFSKKNQENNNVIPYKTIQGDFFTLYNKHKELSADGSIVLKKFDLVAGFYIIEHLKNQKKFWKSISSLVKKDGLLLLSMPSSFGPSFYFHSKEWQDNHPKDHFVDYSPLSIKIIAEKFNFKVLHTSVEGVHPHRLPLWNYLQNKTYLKEMYFQFIRKFVFSDTIFVVLQKVKGVNNLTV